jgi:hypothetical protein
VTTSIEMPAPHSVEAEGQKSPALDSLDVDGYKSIRSAKIDLGPINVLIGANTLMKARLAPDQFALDRQIQTMCDNAKFIAGRLTGKEWPAHPDTETAFDQLRTRIAAVVSYLKTFKPDDFAGAGERKIVLPWVPDKWMIGDEYAAQFALPNFYFHAVTAYAILRHNGVELGKRTFLGNVPMHS